MTSTEEKYVRRRIWKSRIQSIPFYICRILPITKNKIVFCCIEGTTGYSCNPKYIAEEIIRQNNTNSERTFELVWLVNDISKSFPAEIKAVKNTLWNRAYQLSTAKYWIDNSRKQLECRKRKRQIYIQTWHAKLGFKPTCLDRGASFSKIAYLVSKHDSDMVDYWLSNSDWYDKTLKTGSLYEGKVLRTGTPRCDILVKAKNDKEYKDSAKRKICKNYSMDYENIDDVHFLMYAPTFRGGSQGVDRKLKEERHFPNFEILKSSLERKFGGTWYIFLRLHPQLVARGLDNVSEKDIVDISKIDDMYEILAACDAFMTDYSSAAFDAMIMEIPIFLYCDDYEEYEEERGKLLWNMKELPFVFAENNSELISKVERFEKEYYLKALTRFNKETVIEECGNASEEVRKIINTIEI